MAIDWIALFVALPITILAVAFIVMWRASDEGKRESRSEESSSESKTLWGATIALTVVYLMAGLPKLVGTGAVVSKFSEWGYSEGMMLAVGLVEMFGAVLLLFKRTATLAAVFLGVVMIGSTYTHLAAGEYPMVIAPVLALIGLAYVGYERSSDMFITSLTAKPLRESEA